MGAVGGITASAHVCTARFVAMVECGLAGKLDDGRHHAEALLPVIETGFAEPNPAVWKGVLHAQVDERECQAQADQPNYNHRAADSPAHGLPGPDEHKRDSQG